MNKTYKFKKLNKSLLQEIMTIEKECFLQDTWDEECFEGYLSFPFVYKIGLLDENGNLTGYVFYDRNYNSVHIHNLAVKPEYQKQGIATKLINYVIKTEKKDLRDIYLEVRRTNEPAISLYKKFGFVPIGSVRGAYENGEDALVMEKRFKNYGKLGGI